MEAASQSTSWRQSGLVRFFAGVLLPPLGLAILWTRPRTGIFKKLFGTLALLILTVGYLVAVFGLRVESDGTGAPTLFTFETPESRAAALEKHRSGQRAASPPQTMPAAAAAAAPAVQAPGSKAAVSPADAPATYAPPPYWTDFRGPHRDARYDEMPVLASWPSAGLPPLWRQPVGGGYASFVVAEGRAFTIEQRRDEEVVAAYDLLTGRELWANSWTAHFREAMGGPGPRATPTWHDSRLYALGATGEFRCLDAASGKVLWRKNILSDNAAENLVWGMAASPLVVDDKVIVLPGGGGGKSVVAYHRLTGEPVWRALDDKQAYTAPMVATLAGQRQLIVVSASRIIGMTIEDGRLLWSHPWVTEYDVNSAQPVVVGENRLLVSAGYDHGAVFLEISRSDGAFAARPVWENRNLKNKFNSSVLHNGYVYGFDESILVCLDASSGERKWKGGRYGYGQMLLAGGNLVVLSESGELALVRASPDSHQELARFSALEGKTWNVPALAGGILLVRNTREMAAFDLRPK